MVIGEVDPEALAYTVTDARLGATKSSSRIAVCNTVFKIFTSKLIV